MCERSVSPSATEHNRLPSSCRHLSKAVPFRLLCLIRVLMEAIKTKVDGAAGWSVSEGGGDGAQLFDLHRDARVPQNRQLVQL